MTKNRLNRAKRPANKICPQCKRRALAPEGGLGDWYFPKQKICFNCTCFNNGVYDQIRANKLIKIKTVEQANKSFPLYIIDISENELIGKFEDFKSGRRALNFRRADFPKSKIKIIDTKYHDFTDYFLPRLK